MKLLSILLALTGFANAAIMGIDFGTDWLKVALVKPGVPMDLVLTKDSQRKSAAAVTIRDGVRYYGSDAVSQGLRLPQNHFGKLKNLVGRKFSDALAQEYRDGNSNEMVASARGLCAFKNSQNASQVYTVEELIAMQFANARKNVEQFAEEVVKDVVFTVPPFWT